MRGVIKRIAVLLLGNMLICGANAFADGDKLVVSLKLKEEYNDNIFFNADNEMDDYITTVSPGVELRRSYERTYASLKGLFDVAMYTDNSDLNNVDQLYTAGISHKLTQRLSLSSDASYKRDSRPDRDIEETGLALGTDIRNKQRYTAGIDYVLSEKSNVNVKYAHNRDDYDDPTLTDYDSHTVKMGLAYNLSYWLPLTTGRITTGYSRYNYPYTSVDNYNLTFGGERRLTEIYSYYADLGGRFTRPDDGDDSSGGVLKFGIKYKGEITSGNAFFSHDIRPASGSRGLRERTSFVVSLKQRMFTEKMIGSLRGGYYLNKSDRRELSVDDTDEHTIRISPRLTYRITQNVKLDTSYTYTRIKDKARNDYMKDRNLVFIGLVIEYPFFE